MAFPSGHNPRSGFAAGQLRDGQSIGTFTVTNYVPSGQSSAITVLYDVRVRYYQNTLIAVVGVLKQSDNSVVEAYMVKQAQYLLNVANAVGSTAVPTLRDLATLVASLSKLQSLNIPDNGNVPTQPSDLPIPFQQDADGYVKAYVDPSEVNQKILETLTSNVTGSTTTTTGTSSTAKTTTQKVLIGVGIAAAVILAVVLIAKIPVKKKK